MKISPVDLSLRIPSEVSSDNKVNMNAADKIGTDNSAVLNANGNTDSQVKLDKSQGISQCKTCSQRKYQDKSSDPNVSFQAATHLDPTEAAGAVASHENEHVVNEKSKASKEGRRIVAQSVQIFTDLCPECGRRYVSGGKTKTVTKSEETKDFEKELNNKYFGIKIDLKV
ncbi:MAG: hypothetical protein ACM3RX_08215 [Methanococcaceae archaeon]